MKKNYCYHLYKSMYIFPQSEDKVLLSPCCHYNGDLIDAGDLISINHPILEENRRIAEETGELPEHICWNCIDREKRGLISTRQIAEEKMGKADRYKKELLHLNYITYTNCNLACIHCSPVLSSTWQLEVDKYYEIQTPTRKTKNALSKLNIDFENVPSMLVSGGEPLLNKETERVLAKTHTKLHQYRMFTNGTTLLPDNILKYLKSIPYVVLNISLDGYQDAYEYIRWPGKWQDFLQFHNQLDELNLPNIEPMHISNIGVHNIHRITEAVNFSESLGIKSMIWNTDGILDLKHLPADAITTDLIDKINNLSNPEHTVDLIKLIDRAGSDVSWKWVGYLDQLDIIRNSNWRETMKDLWESVKHYEQAHFNPDNLHIHHLPGSQNRHLEHNRCDIIPTTTVYDDE